LLHVLQFRCNDETNVTTWPACVSGEHFSVDGSLTKAWAAADVDHHGEQAAQGAGKAENS
jgi:hypothetical protein